VKTAVTRSQADSAEGRARRSSVRQRGHCWHRDERTVAGSGQKALCDQRFERSIRRGCVQLPQTTGLRKCQPKTRHLAVFTRIRESKPSGAIEEGSARYARTLDDFATVTVCVSTDPSRGPLDTVSDFRSGPWPGQGSGTDGAAYRRAMNPRNRRITRSGRA
jgi:hypothetical protein